MVTSCRHVLVVWWVLFDLRQISLRVNEIELDNTSFFIGILHIIDKASR